MTLEQKIQSVTKDFVSSANWEERYKKIIQFGRELPDLPESLRTEESKVKGCQSQVWLHASLDDQGRMQFQGDADAVLVKGLVALLLKIYGGSTPDEVLATPPDFLKEMGFEGNLSPSRANGLFSMIKQIRNFAIAFQFLLKQKK